MSSSRHVEQAARWLSKGCVCLAALAAPAAYDADFVVLVQGKPAVQLKVTAADGSVETDMC